MIMLIIVFIGAYLGNAVFIMSAGLLADVDSAVPPESSHRTPLRLVHGHFFMFKKETFYWATYN